ncbi:hypothetical protein [Vibrio gallaecicus]|uniref:hypothetical protein n=1 Tax=Vibrio gallaecicus TaxID=552386 RepID=UPI0025B56639|nr:hypothetical protein [Vibrio gallaecicus]MDN3613812.1 hypothetical protein [Vibrio gallaecicus]
MRITEAIMLRFGFKNTCTKHRGNESKRCCQLKNTTDPFLLLWNLNLPCADIYKVLIITPMNKINLNAKTTTTTTMRLLRR